jgi:3'(2'), 5'-bisphosphate nucleotidase
MRGTEKLGSSPGLVIEVTSLVRSAGKAVMDIYNGDEFQAVYKDDLSPLTAADIAANAIIVSGLKKLTPGVPVLSEESADVPYEERRGWERFWLVDPLDGTKEFLKKNNEFTVNVALIEEERPTLGVVMAPALGVIYCGAVDSRGGGAIKIREARGHEPERITVKGYTGGVVRVVASRSHRGALVDRFLELASPSECMSRGSSLKFCLVADGTADVYPRFGPTMEWDTAAADAVVTAAGGTVTDLDGNGLRYNKEDLHNPYFIATGNPPFPWREFIKEIAREEKA